MLGLIKKDFFLIKANMKSMMIVFIVYLVLAIEGTMDVSFIVPFIGIMLFISTFSYDDYNNWNSYAITFPNGRNNVVKAKYISSIMLIFVLVILSLVLTLGVGYYNNDINFGETLLSLLGTVLSSVIIISLLYPIIFKYGSANGRIILFSVIFGLAGLMVIISKIVDLSFIANVLSKLDDYFIVLIPLLCVLFLNISYLVSKKIYNNKEF